MKRIKIGTRGSELALAQTNQVIAKLKEQFPDLELETVVLHTEGDKILDRPLLDFGGKGVFITEFEEALLDGRIDLAVHSSKDIPMELSDGLTIAGTLKREDARDVLVTKKGMQIKDGAGIVIGTGSLRRQFQLKTLYPKIQCINIRGNVQTRLKKILQGQCDGVVLAAAGLKRLGLTGEAEFDYRYFSYEEMIPAGGQGVIAMEGRNGDFITERIREISDRKAYRELETERKVLKLLDAGCHEAVGVISEIQEEQIVLQLIQEKEGKIYRRQGKDRLERRLQLAENLTQSEKSPTAK